MSATQRYRQRGAPFLGASNTLISRLTPDPQIRQIMHTVALREAEHAASFEKRLNELSVAMALTSGNGFGRTLHINRSRYSRLP